MLKNSSHLDTNATYIIYPFTKTTFYFKTMLEYVLTVLLCFLIIFSYIFSMVCYCNLLAFAIRCLFWVRERSLRGHQTLTVIEIDPGVSRIYEAPVCLLEMLVVVRPSACGSGSHTTLDYTRVFCWTRVVLVVTQFL